MVIDGNRCSEKPHVAKKGKEAKTRTECTLTNRVYPGINDCRLGLLVDVRFGLLRVTKKAISGALTWVWRFVLIFALQLDLGSIIFHDNARSEWA